MGQRLGTPISGNLANCTGYLGSTLSGLGTGVATALGVNVGTDGAFVVKGGALGTPISGSLANCTGYPSSAFSGQYSFPATQNASANANTLDDYEEGTWTPAMSFGGGTTGITYSTQVGIYLKIGKGVWYHGVLTLTAKGSSTGSAKITGLPFTEATGSNSRPCTTLFENCSSLTGNLLGTIGSGSTAVELRTSTTTGFTDLTEANFTNTTTLRFNGYYNASS